MTPQVASATSDDPAAVPARPESAHVPEGAAAQAQAVSRSHWFRALVRAGFVARGATYGIIGALALALALGSRQHGAATNQQGALALIASAPLGEVALLAIALGVLAYALWKLLLGILGRGPEGGGGRSFRDRLANIAGGVVYLGFFGLVVSVLTGSGSGSGSASSSEPRDAAAGVLGWPGGRLLVALAGAIFIIVCIVQAFEGASGRFLNETRCDEMGEHGTYLWVDIMGRVGLVARAAVFAVVGYFLVRTAIDHDPNSAIGLDGALRQVHDQTHGSLLLALVATGLLVFAVFSLAEARYRRL